MLSTSYDLRPYNRTCIYFHEKLYVYMYNYFLQEFHTAFDIVQPILLANLFTEIL